MASSLLNNFKTSPWVLNRNLHTVLASYNIEVVLQKSISDFECQYSAFYFNKNHQKYVNITP